MSMKVEEDLAASLFCSEVLSLVPQRPPGDNDKWRTLVKVSELVAGMDLLEYIRKEEAKLIDLAKRDYRDWGRSGPIQYEIQPRLLHLISCVVLIDKGEVVERRENPQINDDFLRRGI